LPRRILSRCLADETIAKLGDVGGVLLEMNAMGTGISDVKEKAAPSSR